MPDWSAMSLRDVALDADLALHERAHGRLGVAVDEQRLGGRPVDLDAQVGGLEVARAQDEPAARRVDVGEHVVGRRTAPR